MRYIQIPWMMCNREEPTAEEIAAFRTAYVLPPDGPCEMVPLAGLLNTGGDSNKGGNHYCCVIWMPQGKVVHILGRRYMSTGASLNARNWEEWGGPIIWRNLTILHGWGHIHLSVRTLDWVQNGYDCGPIACQVLESIWISGFQLNPKGIWKKPRLPCCHRIRMRIAGEVHASILGIYQASHQESSLDDGGIQMSVINELDSCPAQRLLKATKNLERAMTKCSLCLKETPRKPQKVAKHSKPLVTSIPSRDIKKARGGPGSNSETGDTSDSEHSSSSLPSDITPANANRGIHVDDWSQVRLGRFPRPPGPVLPPLISLRGLWSAFDQDFDDYEDGPTLEDLDAADPPFPNLFGDLDVVYMANKIIKNPWTAFKDQGYRLLPSFADMFHQKRPIMILEHMSPVGVTHPPPSLEDDDSSTSGPSDAIVVGAAEMLDAAERFDDDGMFLTGKTVDNDHICLDLQRDAIIPQSIGHCFDLDSTIWTTLDPVFNLSLNVYTMPHIRKKPPIWKHNHAYVDLLLPQSDKDRFAQGSRTEWWTRRFRLSQIPHIFWGYLGLGSGSINVYLCFPRMTHKHPHNGRWISFVPSDVQNFFWKKVMTPAMQEATYEIDQPYVGLSRENLNLKMGSSGMKKGGEGRRAPSFPFRPELLRKLTKAMLDIVSLNSNVTSD